MQIKFVSEDKDERWAEYLAVTADLTAHGIKDVYHNLIWDTLKIWDNFVSLSRVGIEVADGCWAFCNLNGDKNAYTSDEVLHGLFNLYL